MAGRYDKVKITNAVDGTVIEGHEAVAAHFEREQRLLDEHGSTVTFQLFRANLAGETRAQVQGEQIAELRVEGGEIPDSATVADVKQRLLPALLGDRPTAPHVTFVFARRVMRDDALFFSHHFMLLPSWVQVMLSDVPFADVVGAMKRLPA